MIPSDAELLRIVGEYARVGKERADNVRKFLTQLNVTKLTELTDEGKLSLVGKIGGFPA